MRIIRNDDVERTMPRQKSPSAKLTDGLGRETADYVISTGRPISECCRELGYRQ